MTARSRAVPRKPRARPTGVAQRVAEIVATQLESNPADLSPRSRLVEDLGMDSVAAAEIIAQLEEDFDIEFGAGAMAELAEVKTVGDLAASVAACLKPEPARRKA